MWKKCLQPLLGFFGTYVGDKTCNLRKGLGNFLDQGWCCQGTTRVACSWCIGNKKFLIEPALPTLLHIEICGSFQPLEKIILCKVACATYKYLPRRGGLRVMKSRSNVLIYEQNTHQIPPPFCSLLTFGQEIHHEGQNCRHGGKMCGCYSVTCLSWTPILDWCVWLSENQITNITKTCVWKRLGSIFNFLLTHVTIDIEHNLEGMFVFS